MQKVVFRVDANKTIGTGHATRCMALAQYFSEENIEGIFLMKDSKEFGEKIRKEFSFKEIKACSLQEDAKKTIEFVQKLEPFAVITDSYEFDENYLQKLKKCTKLLISIDDLNALDYYASDIILNQNIYAKEFNYRGGNKTLKLLGTKYYLLDKAFEKFKEKRDSRKIKERVKKILLTFGGCDFKNLNLKTVKALNQLDEEFNTIVVLGKFFEKKKELLKEIESSEENKKFIVKKDIPVKDFAELMFEADISVSAAGTTVYQLAFCGLPTITICQAENQFRIAEKMQQEGFSLNLGPAENVSEEQIIKAVKKIFNDKETRKRMSNVGKKLVDGKGCKRVIEKIFEWG